MSEQAMQALEQTATYVATLTGIRQQFLDAGWSQEAAEHLVVYMVRAQSVR